MPLTNSEARPSVIGFDGLHRVGKGTQAELLAGHVVDRGGRVITVRGDGTREGLGHTTGDPLSPEWQERSRRLKTFDRTVTSWNLASYILMRELNDAITEPNAPDVIIVDRTVISRASFLLHRGAIGSNNGFTLDDLYPDNTGEFSLSETIPDVIFDMQVGSPEQLLNRLNPSDPKYEFRAENIRGGFQAAREATSYLPEDIRKRVEFIDAGHDPEVIHTYIVKLLGQKGVNSALFDE